MEEKYSDLIQKAKDVTVAIKHNSRNFVTGVVGAAILSDQGNIYPGVSVDTDCGIGFCAERAAAAQMLSNKEDRIKAVVAVTTDGKIVPPCMVCREFMYQMNYDNLDADIITGEDKIVKLGDLMPERWQDSW